MRPPFITDEFHTMKLDILVIAAHPDDAELGCGGTLIKHKELGYKTGIIDLTEGELGTRGTAETRNAEAKKAAEILGLDIRDSMKFRDGWFKDDEEHRMKIIAKIRQYRPEIVITNAPTDRHPDHGRASKLVSEATWMAGLAKVSTHTAEGKEQEHWRPKHIYHFVQHLPLTPDFVVDISGYIEKKMEAVLAYSTQFYDPNSTEKQTLIAQPSFLEMTRARIYGHGNYALIEHGEGFISAYKPAVDNLFNLK